MIVAAVPPHVNPSTLGAAMTSQTAPHEQVPRSDATLRLPTSGLLAFATGSIGMAVWVTVPGLLLLFFLTDVLKVSPAIAGLALLVPKLADIVLHPFVGRLSDRHRARSGHRLLLLGVGCALPLAFAALFLVPDGLLGVGAAIWVAVVFVVGNLLFAAYQVPYLATPADLRIDYHERTRLMAFRMIVLTAGILLSGVAAPALTGGDTPTRRGYLLMSAVLGVVTLLTMVVGILGVRRLSARGATPPASSADPGHARGTLLGSLRDKQFRPLVGAYLVTSTATHLVLAGVPYYATYVLGRTGLTAVLMGAFLAPALLTTPLWTIAARRWGKQRGLLVAQGTFALGSVLLALGGLLPTAALIAVVAVLGTSFAALQLLAFSMLPDVANAEGAVADPGSYTGVWTASDSAGGALGPYLYSACLAIGGYVGTTVDDEVVQSASAVNAVQWGFGAVPAVLMLAAVLLQRRYTLDRTAR
jgi:GPH family glycoside/pentoside/hexuronide:cation symporter